MDNGSARLQHSEEGEHDALCSTPQPHVDCSNYIENAVCTKKTEHGASSDVAGVREEVLRTKSKLPSINPL